MPRPVLQWVALALVVACLGSFALGLATAPAPGRLPGERKGESGTLLQATEATPLGEERIEGPAPPPELSDEEKARLADEKEARAEAAALAKAESEKAAAQPVTPPPAQAPAVVEPAPPPPAPKPEEPPF